MSERTGGRSGWQRDPSTVLTGLVVTGLVAAMAFATPFPDTVVVDDVTAGAAAGNGSSGSSGDGAGAPAAGGGVPAEASDGSSASPVSGGATSGTTGAATTPGSSSVGSQTTVGTTPAAGTAPAEGTAPGGTTTSPGGGDGAAAPDVANPEAPPQNGGETYQGVTATSVLWGVSSQKNGCGGFDQGEIQRGFGINSNHEVNYELMVEYWNTFPLVDYPLPPEIRANVNPENGYWGRTIESVFRDSGGFACQDVGRANAVRMAEEDRVFGLIMPPTDGPEVPMSLVMAQHQLIHIGRWMTGPNFWGPRDPYFFDGRWGSNVAQKLALGSWICRDWEGGVANDTGDVTVTGLPRKFGVAYPDVPDFQEAADVLQSELGRCGLEPQRYAIPFDLSTLAANAQTVVTRMRNDGVTTILSVNDFLTRLLMMQAATQQNWHPEWVVSGMGNGSFPGTYTTFMTPDQAANVWGAVDNAAITDVPFTETESYLAFKRIRPNEEPDDAWENHYEQFKLLAMGLAGAGPDLTPETFAQGLYTLCNPCHRNSPLDRLERVAPGDPTDIEGFTLVKWNPDKPCHVCRPDGNGNPPAGYFDFLEDGRRYGLTIRDPAS